MKLSFRILMALSVGLVTPGVCAWAQNAPGYDALVRQGNTQLQAGKNAGALASANAATKLNANRWEAYAVAGGALMNLKRNEEAADQFGHAIDHAPEVKQAGLRELRRQCLLAESGSSPASAQAPTPPQGALASKEPSYADTVRWIQEHIKEAGFPAVTVALNEAVSITSDDVPYVAKFDGCNMSLSVFQRVHVGNQSSTRSWTISVPLNKGVGVMNKQILPTQTSHYSSGPEPPGFGPYWYNGSYPTVFIGLPDDGGGATWSRTMTTTDASEIAPSPAIVNKPLGAWWPKTKVTLPWLDPRPMSGIQITYARPGTEESPQHMIDALHHLVEVCTEDPNQGPKSLF